MVFRGGDKRPPEPLVMLLPMFPMRDVRLETLDTTLFASKVSETSENRIDADFLALAVKAGGEIGLWLRATI